MTSSLGAPERRLLDRAASVEAASGVAHLVASELGWDGQEVARQVEAYRSSVAHEVASGDESVRAVDAASGPDVTTPTAPIGFGGPAAAVRPRLGGTTALDGAVLDALREACPDTVTDAAARAEASRDWWPLAMHWALADQVGGLAGAVCRPAGASEVAALLPVCHAARPRGHRGRRPQRRLRRQRAPLRWRAARPDRHGRRREHR